jgi:hypothetical protein
LHEPQFFGSEVVSMHADEQQVLLHDVLLHTHDPFEHAWPAPHGPPDPHAHAPVALHRSVCESHAAHDLPCVPHEGHVVMHDWVLEQQPDPHDESSHTQCPDEQCWPVEHLVAQLPQWSLSVSVSTSQPALSALDGQWA